MDYLRDLYSIENADGVFEFLKNHGYLTPFVIEAAGKFRDYFGKDVALTLHHTSDYQSGEGLFVDIHTKLSVDEALDVVDKIDKEWFLPNSEKTKGKFCFDVCWRTE